MRWITNFRKHTIVFDSLKDVNLYLYKQMQHITMHLSAKGMKLLHLFMSAI